MEYVKIVVGTHTGYCGMDSWEFYKVNADSTDDERADFAYERGLDHAESYGIYPYPDEGVDDEDSEEQYSHNIEGWWEPYDPQKHDRYRVGGDTSWEEIDL